MPICQYIKTFILGISLGIERVNTVLHQFFKLFKYFADNEQCKPSTLCVCLHNLVWDREMLRLFLGIAENKKIMGTILQDKC